MPRYIATFPTPPDPATTPKTKLPVSQQFAVAVLGAIVFSSEYAMDILASDAFEVAEESEVELTLTYTDASGLVSAPRKQTFTVAPIPDTIPPDAPGEFGEIKLVEEVPVEPTPTPDPAPVDPAAPTV